jgi:hypothetical protein
MPETPSLVGHTSCYDHRDSDVVPAKQLSSVANFDMETTTGRRSPMKPKMKINFRISVMAMLLAALFVVAHTGQAQRVRPGKVQSLQATVDSGVPHPATAAITEPALLTCMNATSEVPNSKPAPSCHIVAPGFTGNLQKGGDVKLTAAGNVTLTCNGQGPMLRCAARLQIPPPAQSQ